MTATRFINVYDMGKSNNLLDLDVPISGLYLLAAPGTPEEARAEAIARAVVRAQIGSSKVVASRDQPQPITTARAAQNH